MLGFVFREKIVEKFADFYKAFQKYDTKKRGYLSVREIQKVLFDLNFFLTEEQFYRLLDRCVDYSFHFISRLCVKCSVKCTMFNRFNVQTKRSTHQFSCNVQLAQCARNRSHTHTLKTCWGYGKEIHLRMA